VATPEKALLDLVYLQPGGDTLEYLQSLRLQNMDRMNPDLLKKQADTFASPKMRAAVKNILQLIQEDSTNYEDL